MSNALKYMIVANLVAPIMATIFFETVALADSTQFRVAIIFLAALLFTNIYHACRFRPFRTANILLFLLNGLSLIFLGSVSFITGLYTLAMLILGTMH